MCEETYWDFLQGSLIPSNMKFDSCGSSMHIVVHKRAALDGCVSFVEMVEVRIGSMPRSLCATTRV